MVVKRREGVRSLHLRRENGRVISITGVGVAPWCERETAEDIVITLGAKAVDWWDEVTPVTHSDTLVVARPRNRAELTHFSRRTYGLARICRGELSVLEPGLSECFAQALFCCKEAHLDSCRALQDMAAKITELGGEICLGASAPNRVDLEHRSERSPQEVAPGARRNGHSALSRN